VDLNRLTQKSQEALHDAQTKALRYNHSDVDGEHLLLGLLEQPDGLAPRLLQRAGADPDSLTKAVDAELARRPRVTGPGVAPGEVRVTQRFGRLLDSAEAEARRLKDDYVSVEHLLLAVIGEGVDTQAGRTLREYGVTRESFLSALTAIRGNQRVRRRCQRRRTRPWRSTAVTWSPTRPTAVSIRSLDAMLKSAA